MRKLIVVASLCLMACPGLADAQTRYFAREKVIRAQDIVNTPTPPVKGCGTTMKKEIWGVDADGWVSLTSGASGVANALTFCEAKFKTAGPGVCGYWTNGTVYYWKTIRTENRNNAALMGTICQ